MTATPWLRTEAGALRAPWQIATFALVLVAASALVGGLGYALISPTPLIRWARVGRIPLDQLATLGSLALATWWTGYLLGRERDVWRFVGLDRGAWKARGLVVGSVAGIGVVAVPAAAMLAVGLLRIEPAVSTDSTATVAWAALALMMPAALSEELLFRGFIFSVLRDAAGPARAIVLSSAAFGLAHLTNPGPTIASTLAVAVAGVFLAVVRVTTASLAAAFAAHFWVNYAQAALLHAPVSGLALQTPGFRMVDSGPDWLTGGAWGPEGGAAVVVAMLAASLLLQNGEGGRQKAEARAADSTG